MALNGLNLEQRQAAQATLGHNLIIASAGTGKTSTIVGRIAHLLYSGVRPEKILLLTFTNKAAGEMLARLERYFPKEIVSVIESGTFHAVCYRWLKAKHGELVLKQPSELKTLFKSIYETYDFSNLNGEPFSALYLYELYSLYQNASLDPFEDWFLEKYIEHEPFINKYIAIIEKFEIEKREYGFVSFNDLLLRTIEELKISDIGFDEILVDEYQDTNTLQGALIDAMKPSSLFCVGDYDQSIYAFNGANIENISTFTKRYKNANLFSLITNYRSTASILALANRVIEYNPRIYPKKLRVGREGEDNAPKLLVYHELFEQYHAISHSIKTSHVPYDEIAVIFRNNSSADGIEATLRELGVPCKRKGGTSFFDAKEVKFLLDMLSLKSNPKDMMAFLHIFEYARGVGPALAKEFFLALIHCGKGNLMNGILDPSELSLPKTIRSQQSGLFQEEWIEEKKADIKSKHNHPLHAHDKISSENMKFFDDFCAYLRAVKYEKNPAKMLSQLIKSPIYLDVIENLSLARSRLKNGEVDTNKYNLAKERIVQKAKLLYELATHYNDLARFLNAMILGGSELSQGEGVNLLTVHASKGLEFLEVYVIDLMDGRFPNTKLMSKGGDLEEERRLFYVAVTRAKEKLYLSLAQYDKVKKTEFKPSIFLYEAKLLKEHEELKSSI
ncbi:MAG: ATP-dependent helicase [Sulfurovaceae bacterium]